MRAAGDAGPYGSESGAVSKFENISKRTDISTSRAGATRGGITNNIKNHEASQKPPLRSNGAAHYRAERGSGSDKRIVSDSLYDDVQHLGFRGVRGDRFLTYPNRAGSLETCGFKRRFWSLLGLRPKVTRARGHGTSPSAAGRNGTAGGKTLNRLPPHSRCRSHVPQGKFPRSFCTVKVLYTSCDFPSRTPTAAPTLAGGGKCAI